MVTLSANNQTFAAVQFWRNFPELRRIFCNNSLRIFFSFFLRNFLGTTQYPHPNFSFFPCVIIFLSQPPGGVFCCHRGRSTSNCRISRFGRQRKHSTGRSLYFYILNNFFTPQLSVLSLSTRPPSGIMPSPKHKHSNLSQSRSGQSI